MHSAFFKLRTRCKLQDISMTIADLTTASFHRG